MNTLIRVSMNERVYKPNSSQIGQLTFTHTGQVNSTRWHLFWSKVNAIQFAAAAAVAGVAAAGVV